MARMDPDVAEFLGIDLPKRGRPPKPENVKRQEKAIAVLDQLTAMKRQELEPPDEQVHMTVSDMYQGVTVSWLSKVFDMDAGTVKKRLADCPPLHRRKTGFVYALKTAAPYLIKPNLDIDSYLKTMKPSDLPVRLNEAYWSAMRARQAWEEKAGHLWPTKEVMAVFGDVFQTIKFTMQLWPDNIERMQGLASEQRKLLVGMLDEMQKELHAKLIEMPQKKRTPSSLAEAEYGLTVVEKTTAEIEDIDDDYSELI